MKMKNLHIFSIMMQTVCIHGRCLKNYLWMVLSGKKMCVSKFNEDFIKSYDEDSDKRYILEADLKYPRRFGDLHSGLPFLPERMKVNKCNKLICNLYNKNKYGLHIKLLKQALNHGLILKKVYRVIQFNQEVWLEEHINDNIDSRKKKKILRKIFTN